MRFKIFKEDFLDDPLWGLAMLKKQVGLHILEHTICQIKGHHLLTVNSKYARMSCKETQCVRCRKIISSEWAPND